MSDRYYVSDAPKVTEAALLAQVRSLARLLGWSTYHPFLSRWSEKGFPDLVLIRPPRLVFAELKNAKGKTTDDQDRWLSLLRDCPTVETYLWRPADLDQIAEVLR